MWSFSSRRASSPCEEPGGTDRLPHTTPRMRSVVAIVSRCAVGVAAPFARFARVNSLLTCFTGLRPRPQYALLKLALTINKTYSITFCIRVKECFLFSWGAHLTLSHKGLGLRSCVLW